MDEKQHTLVAVTVAADTAKQMLARMGEAAKTGADLAELRLDYLRDLTEHDVMVGICRINRIRRKLGLRCKQKRKFKVTTDSRHRLPVAANLLQQQFKVCKPNTVLVSDITYIPTDEGWLYLAGHNSLPVRL